MFMIAQLTGIIARLHPVKRFLVINVHDVGYKVYLPLRWCEQLKVGEKITVHTYHHIREDTADLFGFSILAEVELFEQLIGVAGVGPKAALALLSQFSGEELRAAIIHGDIVLLTQTPGIGKKIAERLVMELKQKLLTGSLDEALTDGSSATGDVLTALQNFGYSPAEIRSVLQQIDRTAEVDQQIKSALAYLSRHHARSH